MPSPSRISRLTFPRLGFVALALGATVLAAAARERQPQTAQPPEAAQAERVPAVQWVGHDSRISAPRMVRVRTAEAWHSLWAEHTGKPARDVPPHRHAAPTIDFTRFEVVGVLGGVLTNTDGFVAETVAAAPDGVHLRYAASSFQSASINGPDAGVRCTPFGLWLIERSDGPVILHEARLTKSGPAGWSETYRFPAPPR